MVHVTVLLQTMCQSYNGDRTLLPITRKGLEHVKGVYAGRSTPGGPIPAKLIEDVFEAMTDHCHTRIILFVAMIDLVYRHFQGERDGPTGCGPALLFSAHVPNTLVRFRSAEMTALHEARVSFQMAERNVTMLKRVLRRYGIALVTLCCCGDEAVPSEDEKRVLQASASFNATRTLADAFGEVREDLQLEDIPREAMSDELRQAFIRIRTHAAMVARAQKDCSCHSIPTLLTLSGIEQSAIERVRARPLFIPTGYLPSATGKVAEMALSA